ncbi:MAG TPA: cell division protein ZapE [Sphingomonas sp.]
MTRVLARYDALVSGGELRPDPAQRAVAARLDRCATELEARPRRGTLLWRVLNKRPEPVRGVYLWGGVGRGKSMLMDLFFACVDDPRKRRVHFHEFMQEVHERLRVERSREVPDPVMPVADAIAEEVRLLAFDEMIVTNSADAMIVSRLFTRIMSHDVTIVATSNRAPRQLYLNGLNREHFLPFIALLEERLDVIALDGETDYRLARLAGFPTWYVPNGRQATDALSRAFFRLTDFPVEDRAHVPSEELPVPGGRVMHVPKSMKGVAVFSFARLCREPRGVPDYLAIARRYHTVIVVGIPVFDADRRNEAARFKLLVDTLYEYGVKLLAAADAQPESLYTGGDDGFEFERTVSRLMEMRSAEYLAKGHGVA